MEFGFIRLSNIRKNPGSICNKIYFIEIVSVIHPSIKIAIAKPAELNSEMVFVFISVYVQKVR